MTMEVKPNYKRVEVAGMPDEWEMKPLRAVAETAVLGLPRTRALL